MAKYSVTLADSAGCVLVTVAVYVTRAPTATGSGESANVRRTALWACELAAPPWPAVPLSASSATLIDPCAEPGPRQSAATLTAATKRPACVEITDLVSMNDVDSLLGNEECREMRLEPGSAATLAGPDAKPYRLTTCHSI